MGGPGQAGPTLSIPHFAWSELFNMLIEVALWCVLALSLVEQLARAFRWTKTQRVGQWVLTLTAVAIALRVLVPFAPANWYLGVSNVPSVHHFSRSTALVPLPLRLLTFDLAQGALAARVFNLLASAVMIPLFVWAIHLAGFPRRVALLVGVLVAGVPMYVRYGASDGSHATLLMLYTVATVAFLRLYQGLSGPLGICALGSALLLGVPIRLESGVLFLFIPLLLWSPVRSLWSILTARPLVLAVFLVSFLIALVWQWDFHAQSLAIYSRPHLASAIIALLSRVFFVPNPSIVGFFPPLLAIPAWFFLAHLVRVRAWAELVCLYTPILLCGIPSAFADGPFVGLPAAGYHVISVLFVVLAIARALDWGWDRLRSDWKTRKRSWPLFAAVAALPLAASTAFAWCYTYAWQEEYTFLNKQLPSEAATILTVWDADTGTSDLDCCLALPYPTFSPDRPHLRWIVLGKQDLALTRMEHLQFDYYYPGTMASLDSRSLDSWRGRLVASRPEQRTLLRTHLAQMRELDQLVRRHHHLVPLAREQVPAHTFSSVAFADDQVQLVFYRHIQQPH